MSCEITTYTHIIFSRLFSYLSSFLDIIYISQFVCVIDHGSDAPEHRIFFSQKNYEDLLNELGNHYVYSKYFLRLFPHLQELFLTY